MVQSKFKVETAEKYDDHVWKLHEENLKKGKDEYDDNIHYPMLMKMWRKDN